MVARNVPAAVLRRKFIGPSRRRRRRRRRRSRRSRRLLQSVAITVA